MTAAGSKCRVCKAPAVIDLPRHDLRRHLGRAEQAGEGRKGKVLETLHAAFLHGRDVGRERAALAGGHRQGAQLAGLDLRQHRHRRHAGELHVALQQRGDGGRRRRMGALTALVAGLFLGRTLLPVKITGPGTVRAWAMARSSEISLPCMRWRRGQNSCASLSASALASARRAALRRLRLISRARRRVRSERLSYMAIMTLIIDRPEPER